MLSYNCISRRLGRPGIPSLPGLAVVYCMLSVGVLYKQFSEKPFDYAKLSTLWNHGSQNASRTLLFEAKDLGEEFFQDIIATRKGTFIALNVVASFIIATALFTTRIFLGQLSVIESAQLADRMLRFMLLKVVFLGAVVNPEPADVSGYLLWAIFTAFQKAFVGLAKDRGEALLSSPTATIWQHMRCASLLGLMLVEDAAWIIAGVRLAGGTSPFSWAFLWFFDAACVGIEGIHVVIRYVICGFDRWRAQRGHSHDDVCTNINEPINANSAFSASATESDAESRSQFLYLLDLGSDIAVHILNLVHYGHILHLRGGLRMQLIDVALLTDVRFLLASVYRRGQGHIQYRKLTHKLRYCFPDAPVEDLTKEGGVTCAICMENMRKSAKILPCGHMYHLGCLREWLQQGQGMRCFTCPICRANLMVDEEESDEEEEESIGEVHRVVRVRHRHSTVRRVPETPSPQTGRIRHSQVYHLPSAPTAARPAPRPTVAVYYPSVDDPYFYENDDNNDVAATTNDIHNIGYTDAHYHHSNTDADNYLVSNDLDSWGQDLEVDWDGASCRYQHQEEQETGGRCHHYRRHHRQHITRQSQDYYNINSSYVRNNAVEMMGHGWETDTSGPSSSTIAFRRRGSRDYQVPLQSQEPEEDGDELEGFAWHHLPHSPKVTSANASPQRRGPVTRSMSRGL